MSLSVTRACRRLDGAQEAPLYADISFDDSHRAEKVWVVIKSGEIVGSDWVVRRSDEVVKSEW